MSSELQVASDTLRTRAALDSQTASLGTAENDSGPARESVDSAHAVLHRLAASLRRVSDARSLTAALDALADAAAEETPRTAILLVVDGQPSGRGTLQCWRSAGFAEGEAKGLPEALVAALPGLRALPGSRAAPHSGADTLTIPIVVGDRAVAVLHAEPGPGERGGASLREAMLILGAHASACLSRLTALRLLEATGSARPAPPPDSDHDVSARRYARLLVSEIELYHELAVRAGREHRDLLERLRPEIDRARRVYQERVPASVDNRATLFQQELVQTLAEGDPGALGVPA